MEFESLLALRTPPAPRTVAVAAAADAYVLRAVSQARTRRIATPILCGDPDAIRTAAAEAGVSIQDMEIVPAQTDEEASRTAVALVRAGRADILMKGMVQTATLLRAVLDRETGLRAGGGILSHVGVVHSPGVPRPLLLTDGGMVPAPDLKAKVALIENAVLVARGLGIALPKVAALAAVETVNPDMQATVDAALLTAMNRRGQIKGCVVDGPLAMDLALSEEAARHKGVRSDVAGRADILLFHTIEAANSALKVFTFAQGCLFGGLIVGASAPIVATSRADPEESKLYSIACAASMAGQLA